MQPKTSVRQPVIAGARRQHLSELLRQWRRQPRKRSPLLFWTLLALVLVSDTGLLFLTTRLLGFWEPATPLAEQSIDVSSGWDSALWERLTWDSWVPERTIAPQALYSGLLALGFFAVAAAVRLRWPLWRRRFFLFGMVSCLACLVWSASFLLDQTIQGAMPLIYDRSQAMVWLASVVMGLGLFLTVLFRDAFLALVGALTASIGYIAADYGPLALTGSWPTLSPGAAEDSCLRLQVLTLLSAYAALALAWSTAALTLTRIVLAEPSSERVRRLANTCLWTIRLGVVLLAASTLLDGWRALEQGSGWHRWNAQAMGTLLVLPGCVALLYARRCGVVPPLRMLISVVLGSMFLALVGHFAERWGAGALNLGSVLHDDAGFFLVGLLSLSVAAHASLRYYFGKQRIFEV